MEAMNEEMGDFDEDMPPVTENEDDEEDRFLLPFTPRVALGDVFEQLAEGTSLLGSCSRQGFGWSAADVGGHGLCLADYFTGVTAGSKDIQPPSSSRPTVKLGDIEWAGVQKLHPNKIFCLVIEYIIGRWPHFASRHSVRKKVEPWCYEMAKFAKDPLRPLQLPLITWRNRSDVKT